jgi:sensor domain CHASE-containing protein
MPNTQRAFSVSRYGIEWLLLGSALLVVGLIIGHFMSEMRKDIETRERDQLTVQARVIHDALEQQIDTINRTLVGIRDELPQWRSEPDGMLQAQGFCRRHAGGAHAIDTGCPR